MRPVLLLVLAALPALFCGCAQKTDEAKPADTVNTPALPEDAGIKKIKVTSPAFSGNSPIPAKYTCDGADVNPPLSFEGVPAEAKTLVLIVDDPDAPMGVWDHWVVWNMEPADSVAEDAVPKGGVEGVASDGRNAYHGPCPPSGTHRYRFKVYALDTVLELPPNSGKADVEKAMEGHILAHGVLTGLYSRK